MDQEGALIIPGYFFDPSAHADGTDSGGPYDQDYGDARYAREDTREAPRSRPLLLRLVLKTYLRLLIQNQRPDKSIRLATARNFDPHRQDAGHAALQVEDIH